jgi:hypothetical protein
VYMRQGHNQKLAVPSSGTPPPRASILPFFCPHLSVETSAQRRPIHTIKRPPTGAPHKPSHHRHNPSHPPYHPYHPPSNAPFRPSPPFAYFEYFAVKTPTISTISAAHVKNPRHFQHSRPVPSKSPAISAIPLPFSSQQSCHSIPIGPPRPKLKARRIKKLFSFDSSPTDASV